MLICCEIFLTTLVIFKNHFVFVCQLENLQRNGNLSLQKMWYYVNPIMGFMEILASVVKIINKVKKKQ
jgi:gamma-tubulin complex component 2